jgi:hypothetical protein
MLTNFEAARKASLKSLPTSETLGETSGSPRLATVEDINDSLRISLPNF